MAAASIGIVAIAGFGGLGLQSLTAAPQPDPLGEKTGGETTVFATGRNAFSFPLANLKDDEQARFVIGNSFFRRNWVEAPASTKARDGLGPHFIARSCGGCHVQDGRGAPPEFKRGLIEQPVALLMRLSVPGVGDQGGIKPEPTYGDQLNNFALPGIKPEGQVSIRYKTIPGRFADGTRYSLLSPTYGFSQLGYGPMAKDVLVSPRVAPQVIGVGLLEAIDEADILHNAREQARQPGPIKGEPNRVWDLVSGKMMIGRFGWKANVATLAHQTVAAFAGDIGITSSFLPHENCTDIQQDCRAAPRGAGGKLPEIDDETLDQVIFYQATLAPPARRNAASAQVLQGQRLFAQAQCATCHRPSYVTALGPNAVPFPRLSSPAVQGQRIYPYTDLLLHDMGPGLADGRPDFSANGRQWKTPPLWGTGQIPEVNGHQRLLHDGRARGVLEAILWHGGEADDSRQQVLKMSKAEREALVRFVESL
ncbi:MAG: c-type cytochrome [Rubrivivax sp.]|nr:MAG: c-type cytochrome [Rubrivivax sp.]